MLGWKTVRLRVPSVQLYWPAESECRGSLWLQRGGGGRLAVEGLRSRRGPHHVPQTAHLNRPARPPGASLLPPGPTKSGTHWSAEGGSRGGSTCILGNVCFRTQIKSRTFPVLVSSVSYDEGEMVQYLWQLCVRTVGFSELDTKTLQDQTNIPALSSDASEVYQYLHSSEPMKTEWLHQWWSDGSFILFALHLYII